MKSKIVRLFFLSLLFPMVFIYSQDYQDWKWLHPQPQGNTLRYIKMWDSTNWYAAGYNGTFMKTSDAGKSWYFNHKASGVGTNVSVLPNTIYDAYFFNKDTGLTMGYGGIWITFDAGKTFSKVGSVSSASTWNHFYFLNRQIGYAACSWPGKYAKTTDGGLTWVENSYAPPAAINDIWSPNDTLILLAGADGNVYRSNDGGNSFNKIPTSFTTPINRMKFWNSTTGFVTSSLGNTSLTTNGGLNWAPANNGLPSNSFYDIFYKDSTIYLTGNAYAIYKSTNYGLAWDTVEFLGSNRQLANSYTYVATDFLDSTFVTVGTYGLINSKTGTNTPKEIAKVTKIGAIYDLWVSPDKQNIITVGWPSTNAVLDQIMISTDGGTSWNIPTVNSPSTLALYSINMIDLKTGFAVGQTGAAYFTIDGGATWDPLSSITTKDNLSCVDFVDDQTGWIFSSSSDAKGTIWKTTDGGNSWIQSILTGTSGSGSAIISAHMLNENLGWVLTNNPANPYKTTDGGLTWTKQTLANSSLTLSQIRMVDSLQGYCAGSGKIFKTRNGGSSWDLTSYPFVFPGYSFAALSIKIVDSNSVFVAGDAGLTAESSDGGSSWKIRILSNGQSARGLYTISTADSVFAFCGTNNGNVFKTEIKKPPITGIKVASGNEIPVKYELYQNYPNPFNPETKIDFSLPSDSKVSLKIYNLLGQEIAILIDGNVNKGNHSVNFNASKLSSGMYLYRIEASGNNGARFSFVRKMILIK